MIAISTLNYTARLLCFKIRWRMLNRHNFTTAQNIFSTGNVKVGKYSYGPLQVISFGAAEEGLDIGNFVSISRNAKFLLGGNHYTDTLSTYPFKVNVLGEKVESWSKGPIAVGDDVWICMDATVMSGVKIGKGAVVAAGSIVTRDVPPYSVVAGNPAKVIKYRFEEAIIKEMMGFDFSKIDDKFIRENIDKLYSKLNPSTVKELKLCLGK